MKKKIISLIILLTVVVGAMPTFSAHVIKKEDAALFKKDSIYADINAGDTERNADLKIGGGSRQNTDDVVDKFSVVTASKDGNTYTNVWSNYKLTIKNQYLNANDVYDFYSDGMKFDFGIYFEDYSRIAVYYTRLSRDLSIVCANFAPGAPVTDVTIAGEVYKHVSLDVPYPYGVEKYDYYLRNIEGKLMVIEVYYEEGRDISTSYIEAFERAKE